MKRSLLFLMFIFLAFSCKKESLNTSAGSLIETNELAKLTKAQCVQLVDSADISTIAQYDVQLTEVVYATEFEGKIIKTSGLLLSPIGKDTVHLVNYNHGTFVPLKLFNVNEQIPSLFKGQTKGFDEVKNIGLTWASAGYTVFMPDYVGYNRTSDKEHPYVYFPELFKSIKDGNSAIKKHIATTGKYYDNRLFLSGWSQGGGASLSAQRYYEEQNTGEFNVVASFNLSGPYNFKRFIQNVFENKNETNDKINIYSWALYSLNKFSELKRPNDRFYSYPVYDQVTAFNPPSKVPREIFNNFFIKQIVDGTDSTMNQIIARNSMSQGWTPQGKVFLFHGDADDYVPYFNSQDAYQALSAVSPNVSLITYAGANHYSVYSHYLLDVLQQLELLK